MAELGYTEPTPVQEQGIPVVLEGRDMIAAAKTGTGKTAAFSLPVMDRLGRCSDGEAPRMVVVTPTRELATQIGETCEPIAKYTNHRIITLLGGVSYEPQIKKLRRTVDIVIATPGRLIDLMNQGALSLNNVKVLVIDEADRMLDMGFWPDVRKIVQATPDSRQTLLFSATIDRSQDEVMFSMLHDPAIIEISQRGEVADKIDQYVVWTSRRDKPALLNAYIREKGGFRVIVFTRTKGGADNCTRRLRKIGIAAEAVHANRSQAQRARAVENFRAGKTHVLVATDVLARGIDVPEVDYVINYDVPTMPEDYVHRIGRTGRAGLAGYAVTFATKETESYLREVERLIGQEIPVMKFKAGEDAMDPVDHSHSMYGIVEEPDQQQPAKGSSRPEGGRKGRNGRRGEQDEARGGRGGRGKKKPVEGYDELGRKTRNGKPHKVHEADPMDELIESGQVPPKKRGGRTYNYDMFADGAAKSRKNKGGRSGAAEVEANAEGNREERRAAENRARSGSKPRKGAGSGRTGRPQGGAKRGGKPGKFSKGQGGHGNGGYSGHGGHGTGNGGHGGRKSAGQGRSGKPGIPNVQADGKKAAPKRDVRPGRSYRQGR